MAIHKKLKISWQLLRNTFLLFFIAAGLEPVSAQNFFHGSFLMSFHSRVESKNNVPMLWAIQPQTAGGKMAMEIQDEMKEKGVSKRIVFNPADSTWTMLLEFVHNKQGARVHAAAMFRDTSKVKKPVVKITSAKRVVEGYRCKKIILESDEYVAEAWLTDQITFDVCYIYKLLDHCGLMSEYVLDGDWFNWKNPPGMILELTSTKKSTGESYTMNISGVKPGEVNEQFFDMKGFLISDIPEGQNCGVRLKEQ